jgi:hypothetical protein
MSDLEEGVTTVVINRREASLVELGEQPVLSVSEIEHMGAVFEQVSRDLRTAVQAFMANAARSTDAPIDPGVLSHLRGVESGAEESHRAALAFVAAFDAHYRADIEEARRGERMDNVALTG